MKAKEKRGGPWGEVLDLGCGYLREALGVSDEAQFAPFKDIYAEFVRLQSPSCMLFTLLLSSTGSEGACTLEKERWSLAFGRGVLGSQ